MLGLMHGSFRELSNDCFVTLYKSLVRPHLESGHREGYVIQKTSKKFKKETRIIRGQAGLSYEERLRVLHVPTLRYTQLRVVMIHLYKYVTNKYDVNFKSKLDYQFMLFKNCVSVIIAARRGHTCAKPCVLYNCSGQSPRKLSRKSVIKHNLLHM